MLGIVRFRPFEAPAIDIAQKGRVLAIGAEILDDAEEITDTVIGEAGLVPLSGNWQRL